MVTVLVCSADFAQQVKAVILAVRQKRQGQPQSISRQADAPGRRRDIFYHVLYLLTVADLKADGGKQLVVFLGGVNFQPV